MIDYKVIGARLKKARKDKKMTQEVLSKKLDVSIAFISRIEKGNSHINLKRLSQICEILDISEGFVLNGASSNSENYLERDFKELLDKSTTKEKELIYRIAKTIIED